MQLTTALLASLASLAAAQSSTSAPQALQTVNVAAGQTQRVDVGRDGRLVYSPAVVQAAVGAKVEFHYFPRNHTVTQSSFAAPCQPLAAGNGINSGFVPVPSGEGAQVFTVTVTDTNPMWLYCAQTVGNHCQAGMSMVINEPRNGNNLVTYQLNSKNATTVAGAAVQGGAFSANSGAGATPTPGGPYAGATPTPYGGSGTGPYGSVYTGGASADAVSWGFLGAGAAVLGFFM